MTSFFLQITFLLGRGGLNTNKITVISGLQNHTIFRLKQTWNELSDKTWEMWEEMKDLFQCEKNFAKLRTVTGNASFPAVPYLGMFLSDLTFIDSEENLVDPEDTEDSDDPPPFKLVNFVKMSYVFPPLPSFSCHFV